MSNRYDATQVRDTSLLRAELHRVIASGVQLRFIAELAGVHPKTVSAINSGRRTSVTVAVHGLVLEALIRIETGEVSVPPQARRSARRAVVQGADPGRCGYGHERSADNTRLLPGGKRVCKPCESRRAKAYHLRKSRQACNPV